MSLVFCLYIISHCPFFTTALNEALKKEVERLKTAIGEITTPTDTFNLGLHHISYAQSPFFPPQNTQLPPFHPFQSNLLTSDSNTNRMPWPTWCNKILLAYCKGLIPVAGARPLWNLKALQFVLLNAVEQYDYKFCCVGLFIDWPYWH